MLLVEQGYADTRTKAQAIIMSGQVYVEGQKADKPGTSFEETVSIEVRGATCPYVSRGGLKLEKAILVFDIDYLIYNESAKYLSYFLTPATVSLAIPLYKQIHLLKSNLSIPMNV